MAESSPPDYHKDLRDYLVCGICMEGFDMEHKEPKMLPCQHTFCVKCITQIVEKHRYVDCFPCPLCRKKVTKPGNISELPKNLAMVEILDILGKLSVETEPQVKDAVKKPAAAPQQAAVATKVPDDKCTSHPEMPATNVCMTCSEFLCPRCFSKKANVNRLFPPHNGHHIEEVAVAFDAMTVSMQKKHDELMECLQKSRSQLQEDMKQVEKLSKDIEQKVHEKAVATIRQAEEWEQRMKEKVETIRSQHENVAKAKLVVIKFEEAWCTTMLRNGKVKLEAHDLDASKILKTYTRLLKGNRNYKAKSASSSDALRRLQTSLRRK